jgi:hypothetical protein
LGYGIALPSVHGCLPRPRYACTPLPILTRHGKKILTHVLFSPQLTQTEKLFDYVFPKSMVLYAEKSRTRAC